MEQIIIERRETIGTIDLLKNLDRAGKDPVVAAFAMMADHIRSDESGNPITLQFEYQGTLFKASMESA